MLAVGWCKNCNVPILDGRDCGVCHNRSVLLKLCKAELKPVFDKEERLYKKILKANGIPSREFMPKGTAFYNIMGEVIIDGNNAFRLSYDAIAQDWKVKFPKSLSNSSTSFRGSSLRKTIKANEYILREKENDAVRFIKDTVKRFRHLPVAVSFSGGKDSAVTLALTRLAKVRPDVIFLNTTIEFNETVRHVRSLAKLWRVNLIEVRPPHDFFELCKELGPPSVIMKWCCKTQKFSPQNQLINERYPRGVLVFGGIRSKESNIRSRFRKIQRNRMIPKQVLAFPILKWSSLDIWLYLLSRGIPYNKMYQYGFARIGCWACPEKSSRDLALIRMTKPDLAKKLSQMLEEYADLAGIKDSHDWIMSGEWRHRRTKWLKTVVCTSSQLCSAVDEFAYVVTDASHMRRLREFLKVFGKTSENEFMTKIESSQIDITIIGNRIRVRPKAPTILKVFEKQIARALNCVGCGACVGVCPVGALEIESGEIRIGPGCMKCLQCITANGIRMSCVSVNYRPHVLAVT